MLLEHLPQAFIRADVYQRPYAPKPDPPHQPGWIGLGVLQERLIENFENALRFFGKTAKARRRFRARKIADCGGTAFVIGIEIEPRIRPPRMARNPFGLVQFDLVFGAHPG